MLEIMLGFLLFLMSLLSWFFLYMAVMSCLQYCNPCHKSVVYEQHIKRSVAVSLVSAVQGLLSSGAGITVVWSCRGDVIKATHPLAHWYAWVGIAYFYYDLWAMYQVECARPKAHKDGSPVLAFCRRNPVMVGHHIVVSSVLGPILFYRRGVGDFFVGCFYCLEFSALFTNFRSIISKLGYKSSKLYKVNALMMVLTFALCRVVIFPFMYWCYGAQHRLRQDLLDRHPDELVEPSSGESLPSDFSKGFMFGGTGGVGGVWSAIVIGLQNVPYHCTVWCSVMLLPQLYWLMIMCRTAVKMVVERRASIEQKLLENRKAI